MSTSGSGSKPMVPTMQTVIHNPFAITQNQWYDAWLIESGEAAAQCAAGAGTAKKNVRLHSLSLDQATAGETIEVRVIADLFDFTVSQIAVAGTDYFLNLAYYPDSAVGLYFSTNTNDPSFRSFLLEAKSLQIMYRKTTAVGANNTTIKVIFGLW